jgi:hypothetical protein
VRRLLASLALLLGCVPPADDVVPAGAAGIRFEPSAAARGEPLVTADGWTVRFEKLALLGTVEVRCDRDASGGFEPLAIHDAARPFERFVVAVKAGPCEVGFRFAHLLLHPDPAVALAESYDYVAASAALDPATVLRFKQPADDDALTSEETLGGARTETGERFRSGPALVVGMRGDKDGAVIAVELALALFPTFSPEGATTAGVVVRADAVTFATLDAEPARLLAPAPAAADGRTFGPIAAADADGDGRVTAAELGSAALLVELRRRATTILVPR